MKKEENDSMEMHQKNKLNKQFQDSSRFYIGVPLGAADEVSAVETDAHEVRGGVEAHGERHFLESARR